MVARRWVQGVRGGYKEYEVGTRCMRWVRGVQGGYEVGMRGTR